MYTQSTGGTGSDNMTELERLKAGLPYRYDDDAIAALKNNASVVCAKLETIPTTDAARRELAARSLLGSAGEELDIQPGFHCDNGKNIHVGNRFTANFNVTILDGAEVRFGDYCMVGPNTLIATTGHPLQGAERRNRLAISHPISIGNDVWIGGNCTILGGVHIGSNAVVAAGAVVTKDVPDNCVVAGIPAHVIRALDAE